MKDASNPKVLLVEDVKIAQKLGALVLSEFDCLVDTADSGEEAIELVKNNLYQLIFMDLGLPGIDGIQTTRQIKSLAHHQSKPIIIALTANTDESYQVECLNAGMDGFLAKPLVQQNARECLMKFGLLSTEFF